MRLNYRHLYYFWAVAHDGHLTRTAARLNLSQSALSVQIKLLEERLGHALFVRQGRQLHLTEAGRVALDHADSIFATGQEMLATLEGVESTRQILRVGALSTLSRNFQINFLRPILGLQDVEVSLKSGSLAELMDGLETLRLDVALMNREPSSDTLVPYVIHHVDEQAIGLVGTLSRLDPDQPLVSLLREQPMILPTTASAVRVAFDSLVNRQDIQPRVIAEVDDMAMMRLLAVEDIGLALVPRIVVQDELASGRLVEAIERPPITETFFAVTMERRFPNLLLKRLLTSDGLRRIE
ncbi:MAG: LysR family transcriptional regulator [Aestuariivita sp.]|nr:LysR family transcriptional regulator [Aestuariivita sp.]